MSALAQPLIDYLRQLERQGETHVHLDDRARMVLREFYLCSKGGGSRPVVATVAEQAPAKVLVAAPVKVQPTPVSQPTKVMGRTLDGLRQQIAVDAALRGLGTLRDTLVFSEGQIGSEVMVVGEAPGYHDESKGIPFAGPAGKKMEAILKAMGLQREDVYLTNMVKFRPAMKNQMTQTRKPSAAEIQASMRYLMAEIAMVKPKVIIVLGATAARHLIGDQVPVSEMLGKFHQVAGIPVRATYHPSYLMHKEVTDEKRAVWRDMLEVMELLGMPISEKQRGYFS